MPPIWPNASAVGGIAMTAQMMNRLPIVIANTTLGSDAASIDFTSLPTHYRVLHLLLYSRCSAAALEVGVYCRYNNDSGTNYYHQFSYGLAAGVAGGEGLAGSSFQLGNTTGSTAPADQYGLIHAELNGSKDTGPARVGGSRWWRKVGTTTGQIQIGAFTHMWYNGTPVNRVTIAPFVAGGNLVTGTRATLIGIP